MTGESTPLLVNAAPRPVSWRRRSLLVAASLVVGALGFEIAARTLLSPINISPLWEYHPTLGWTQSRGQVFDVQVEGRPVRLEFNSLGFRDVEHAFEKPAGTKRLVVIGDSFCEAVQVNLDETFWRRLGHALDARGADRWESINLGVGDFGNAQALLALQEFGLRFDPDLVVFELFPLNDIANNTVELGFLARSPNDRYRPYFVARDDELVLTSLQPWRNFLRRHSLAYGVVERACYRVFPGPDVAADEDRGPLLRAAGFTGLDPLLYTFVPDDRQPEVIRRAWRMTESIAERIAATCRDHGVPLVAVVIPFQGLVGDWIEPFTRALPEPKPVPDYADRRFARLFARLGVPCVTMGDYFNAHQERFFPCIDGHLNADGHAATAEELLRVLLEAGLVR